MFSYSVIESASSFIALNTIFCLRAYYSYEKRVIDIIFVKKYEHCLS